MTPNRPVFTVTSAPGKYPYPAARATWTAGTQKYEVTAVIAK